MCKKEYKKIGVKEVMIEGKLVEVTVYESVKPTETDAIHLPLTRAERELARKIKQENRADMYRIEEV